MNYQKTLSRIILIARSTIAVFLVMWSIAPHMTEANSLFKPTMHYDTGQWPSSVAIGDLNGDSYLDLAVANKDSNNVSILINTGGPAKLLYTAVPPCRIVDTRKAGGTIDASTQRDFHVFGSGSIIIAQGGNSVGCLAPMGEPLAAHINMIAVNPSDKGNLQAFPVGAGAGAGLSVNYNAIDTNLANAGTVKTVTGSGPNITVASNFSSAHTVIDVLGFYYPAP